VIFIFLLIKPVIQTPLQMTISPFAGEFHLSPIATDVQSSIFSKLIIKLNDAFEKRAS
jgi:hypothetical protein